MSTTRSTPENYEVAIPSYKRVDTLLSKTLPLVIARGIDPERITLFVDAEELDAYRDAVPRHMYRDMVVVPTTITAARNKIVRHYPEGQLVLSFDDDLQDLALRLNEKKIIPLPSVHKLAVEAFGVMMDGGASLWGIYPTGSPNPMFMQPTVTFGLRVIVGAFMGFRNRYDDIVDSRDKEEVQRTIMRFVDDRAICRYNFVGLKTKYYNAKGGHNAAPYVEGDKVTYRNVERNNEDAVELVRRYPGYVTLNKKGRSQGDFWEVKMRPQLARTTVFDLRSTIHEDGTWQLR